MEMLIVFLLMFAVWYGIAWYVAENSPLGIIARTYGSKMRVKISNLDDFGSSTMTMTKDKNAKGGGRVMGYRKLGPEGYLFCGVFIGDVLRLNRNVLIPWGAMLIREKPNADLLPKLLTGLGGVHYVAEVPTKDGLFSFVIDAVDMRTILEKQWIECVSNS